MLPLGNTALFDILYANSTKIPAAESAVDASTRVVTVTTQGYSKYLSLIHI